MPLVIHFLVPLTTYCLPSGVLVAVVWIPATSDPVLGSVMAMQILFLPSRKSGMNRSCSCWLPNLRIGGMA